MAHGDGTITELSRGCFQVCVPLGRDPITGRYKKLRRTVHGTKADANKLRKQLVSERDNGLNLDAEKLTFSEFAEQWLAARKVEGGVKPRYLIDLKSKTETLSRFIGNVKLADIRPATVESLLAALKDDHEAQRPRSGTTLHAYFGLLKQMLRYAVNHDLLLRNPCDRVRPPKKNKVKRRSLSLVQARKLIACLNESEEEARAKLGAKEQRQLDRGNGYNRSQIIGLRDLGNHVAIRLAMATGMRHGELLGLTWGHVDLKSGFVHVVQSVDCYGNLGDPKSEAGRRSIAIGNDTVERLKKWKAEQAALLSRLGLAQTPQTFVCCSNTGGMNDQGNMGSWWRKWREANGFNGWLIHELRHTQATHLLASGADIKTVQARLGHSTAALTLDIYGHALPANDRAAADTIEAALFSEPKEAQKCVNL